MCITVYTFLRNSIASCLGLLISESQGSFCVEREINERKRILDLSILMDVRVNLRGSTFLPSVQSDYLDQYECR